MRDYVTLLLSLRCYQPRPEMVQKQLADKYSTYYKKEGAKQIILLYYRHEYEIGHNPIEIIMV